MSEEIVKVIKIETDASITSVKDLKKYISDLRDSLVTLDKESEEYSQTVEELTKQQKKLTEVQSAGKSTYSELDDSIKGLRLQLKSLNNTYDELSAADRNSEVGKNLLAKIQSVDAELKELENSTGRHQRSVGNYQLALEALNKTYDSQRQELKALKVAMESLEPTSEAYAKAFNRASEITHNLAEQQEKLKYASPDLGDQLSNIRGIATNMVAGFSAVNAAMGLFGEKNEDVAKAMLKVQQCMAIVQGLQGMDGLLKRTEGLSTAMKTWFNTSKQVTTQTIAQTTAVQGETVATEGATIAQKGLNAAMKANPIGAIITVIMALVAAWTIFGKKITELIKGNEKLNNILTKTKAVLATVGETLKQAVLVPLKEVVNYVKTLGNVMVDVFTGQWGKIGDDIKEGLGNAVDIVKEAGTNIGKAYNESIKEQNEKAERERSQKRAKELEEIIKDNNAKYDSDWKYTESGKTIYEEYLNAKINSYKKDSDEYKEAVREKMSFERDYDKFKDKLDAEATKKTKEQAEKRKKALEDAKKKEEQIEKNYQSLIQKNYGNSVREIRNSFEEQLKAYIAFYEGIIKNTSKDDKHLKWLEGQLNRAKQYLKDFEEKNTFEIELEAKVKSETGLSLEDLVSSGFSKTDIVWKDMKDKLDKISQAYNAYIADAIKNSQNETSKQINDTIIKLYQKTIIPSVGEENRRLENKFAKQKVKLDFEIETGADYDIFKDSGVLVQLDNFSIKEKELDKVNLETAESIAKLNTELNYYNKTVEYVNNNGLIPSEEYENAVQMVSALTTQIEQVNIQSYQKRRDIETKYFNQSLANTEAYTADLIRLTENIHQYNTDLNYKYTEEGKKIYDKYFDTLIGFYDIDSDEYKKAVEEKEAYDKEYQNFYRSQNDERINSYSDFTEKCTDAFSKYFDILINSYSIDTEEYKNAVQEKEAYENELKEFLNSQNIEKLDLVFNFTERGKEIYDKYFENLISSYEVDSEEYKKAIELKESYDKEYQEYLDNQKSNGGDNETTGGFNLDNLKNDYLNIWDLLGGADPEKEQQYMDELYNIELAGLEKIKALWEQRKDDETLTYEERVLAAQSYAETVAQIEDLEVEHQAQTTEKKKELIQTWVDQMSTALNTIGQLFNTLANSYKDDIDAQKKANKISNQEAEKQYNQKVKPLMIAEATISTLQGMVSAFSGAMQLGPIAGPIVGGILAGLVGTMGAINIAKIASTNPYSNNGGSSALANPPSADYNFQPEYTQNVTGAQDIDYLRNTMTEQPIKAYVTEYDITSAQELSNTRNSESTF